METFLIGHCPSLSNAGISHPLGVIKQGKGQGEEEQMEKVIKGGSKNQAWHTLSFSGCSVLILEASC